MVTYEELHGHIHDITELSNVLSYLLSDRGMCDTNTCCELFYRYSDRVQNHLDKVSQTYSGLLSSPDHHINDVANNFMSGSLEIKRIFSQYARKWCQKDKHELRISNYDQFLDDTNELFGIVLKRLQDETEHLYPFIRQVRGDSQRAA